eukprot:scaffold4510_cov183-Amphora_coffeaeformis.AAC.83
MLSTATAHAKGLPIKVGPCINGKAGPSTGLALTPAATSSVAKHAAKNCRLVGFTVSSSTAAAATPSKARGNFVTNEQHVVSRASGPKTLQVTLVVKAHTSRALYQGFDNHGGRCMGMCCNRIFHDATRSFEGVVVRCGRCRSILLPMAGTAMTPAVRLVFRH